MGAQARKQAAARISVRVGALTLVGAVASTAFAVTAKNGLPEYLPGVERTTVKAAFEDSGALRVGDDVRISNVRAGYVDGIEMQDGKSVVTLKLDNGVDVYSDAQASVGARSSLGQKYVEINPGSADAGVLSADEVLPGTQTQSPVELDHLLDVFDEQTRSAAGSTLREIGGGTGGRGDDLHSALEASPELLDDLSKISEALATNNGADLSTLLEAGASLSGALRDQGDEIEAAVRQLSVTVDAVSVDDGAPLEATIEKAPKALADTRAALRALDEPLGALATAGQRLRPAARALGDATPSLRGLLRDAVPPLRKVPTVAPQAIAAFDALTPTVANSMDTADGLARAVRDLAPVITTLMPYTPEMVQFFQYSSNALRHGDAAGHWLRITVVDSVESLPIKTPLTRRNAYPAPGEAQTHGGAR